MTYEEYYKAFVEFFEKNCKTFGDVFTQAERMKKALHDAEHHIAIDKWYGDDK